MRRSAALMAPAMAILAGLAAGQGKDNYLNFEPPENEALAIADVPDAASDSATYYLLVANTPDDSVLVFNAATNAYVTRVPTGGGPIGVHVKPTPVVLGPDTYRPTDDTTELTSWKLAYSVNWSGDSVTLIGLRHILDPETQRQRLVARALRTVWVGDEPTSIDFQPAVANFGYTLPEDPPGVPNPLFENLAVTHGTLATWDLRDAVTLLPLVAGATERQELLDPAREHAVREGWVAKYGPPSEMQAADGPLLHVLNRRGGNYRVSTPPPTQSFYLQVALNPYYAIAGINADPEYDLDVWGPVVPLVSLGAPPTTAPVFGGLGTTNFAMAFAANGDLFVCGTLARNNDAVMFPPSVLVPPNGEFLHESMEANQSGFAQSMLWRVRNVGSGSPTVEPLDLNAVLGDLPKITQPTAIAIAGDGGPGTRVFVTGFASDSLAEVTIPAAPAVLSPADITTRVDLKHPTSPFPTFNAGTGRLDGRMMGPRSLALLDVPSIPPKLFVLNKVERTVYVLDPNSLPATSVGVPQVRLLPDPTPAYIRDGRKFLYSSELSGSGTSSCAICHVDGHSDNLTWNLSGAPPAIPPGEVATLPGAFPNAANKGPMVTQSLRGLVTFEVESFDGLVTGSLTDPGQRMFTTEPLHWRGDKGFLEHFNAAFVGLNGMNQPWVYIDPTNADLNRGIPEADMDAFRDFVFSMHYPPNPEQELDREYSGVANLGSSTEGQLGMELFFITNQERCVTCHAMPFGTNQIVTEQFGNPLDPTLAPNHIETAALRGLFFKEKRLLRKTYTGGVATLGAVGAAPTPAPFFGGPNFGAVTGESGLTHLGMSFAAFASETTRHFTDGFTLFGLPIANPALLDALSIFQREFDTGVAPAIGFTLLADRLPQNDPALNPGISAVVGLMELQVAEVNVGLAARARVAGADHGFRYDPVTNLYIEESVTAPPGTTPVALGNQTRAALLGFVAAAPANNVVFLATPLGAERRFANLTANLTQPVVAASGAVTGITLRGMVPNTAYERVSTFARNPFEFIPANFSKNLPPLLPVLAPEPDIASELFWGVLTAWTTPLFGAPASPVHQPARRFQIEGANVLPDARLRIYLPQDPDVQTAVAPPAQGGTWQPPTTTPTTSSHEWIEMPLYPATGDGANVWETAVELDPTSVYALLVGGPNSPGSLYLGGFPTYGLAQRQADPANPNWANVFFYNTPFLTNAVNNNPGASIQVAATNQWASDLLLLVFPNWSTLGPERWNWYYVEVVNTFVPAGGGPPQTVVSSGGWQRATL